MNNEFLDLREFLNSRANDLGLKKDFDAVETTSQVTKKVQQIRVSIIKQGSRCDDIHRKQYYKSVHDSLLQLSIAFNHITQLQSCLNIPFSCLNNFLYSNCYPDIDVAWRPTPPFASNFISNHKAGVDVICNTIASGQTDPVLAKIVLDYLHQYGYTISSYTQLQYYKSFVQYLCKKLHKQPLSDQSLSKILVYINFNTPQYIRYFLNQVRQVYGPDWNFTASELQIKAAKKKISAMPERNSAPYNPLAPSLCILANKLLTMSSSYNLKIYTAKQQPLLAQKAQEVARKRQLLKEKKKIKKPKIAGNQSGG